MNNDYLVLAKYHPLARIIMRRVFATIKSTLMASNRATHYINLYSNTMPNKQTLNYFLVNEYIV